MSIFVRTTCAGMLDNITRKIDLMIIGAQKSGTTSLLRYLGEHPQIESHKANEFSYFYSDEEYESGWAKAEEYYFGKKNSDKNFVVAKHANLYSSAKAIERLYEQFPQCKLVLLLRNPVSRSYSSYLMEKMYDRVDYEFDELPELLEKKDGRQLESWQEEAFIGFSKYDEHLENVFRFFKKEQVKVILFEDFSSHPLSHCRNLFYWMGVENDFFPRVRTVHNETTMVRSRMMSRMIRNIMVDNSVLKSALKKILPNRTASQIGQKLREANRSGKSFPKMSPEMENYLNKLFHPHKQRLQDLTGLDLSAWK